MLSFLAQSSSDTASAGISIVVLVLLIGLYALIFIGYWKVFVKIGLPGWMGIVPFVNVYMLFKARGQHDPVLFLILCLIPCINIVGLWFLASDTAELFGKGIGWKVFLFLVPGVSHLVLGFGDARVVPANLSPEVANG